MKSVLRKLAGLRQTKRMLEAVIKQPSLAERLTFSAGYGHAAKPLRGGAAEKLLNAVNNKLQTSQVGVPSPEARHKARTLATGLSMNTGSTFRNTPHAQDILEGQKVIADYHKNRSTYQPRVDVFDLGRTRPKDKVGPATPWIAYDTLAPQAKSGRPWPVTDKEGIGRDPRFETVVDTQYLKSKNIGHIVQPQAAKQPSLGTPSPISTYTNMKARLSGERSTSGDYLKHRLSKRDQTPVTEVMKAKGYTEAKFKDTEYSRQVPTQTRYVGRGYSKKSREGEHTFTSQLLPYVPTRYANMRTSEPVYYKATNPQAFSAAMAPYLEGV